jgi:hypothetical protein
MPEARSFIVMLIVVRDTLCSISREDVLTGNDLDMKAGAFYTVFKTLRSLETRRITDTRRDNLKAKRTEKLEINRQVASSTFRRVGRSAPEYTEEEKRVASISDPSISSAGKELFIASYEANCQSLANDFCGIVLDTVFSQDPPIHWVTGRPELPIIQWEQS